jgi:hypothetical protein
MNGKSPTVDLRLATGSYLSLLVKNESHCRIAGDARPQTTNGISRSPSKLHPRQVSQQHNFCMLVDPRQRTRWRSESAGSSRDRSRGSL